MKEFIKQVSFKVAVDITSKTITYIIWRGVILPCIAMPILGILYWLI